MENNSRTPARELLSIIVPVFNEGRYLENVLHYLMRSECPIDREWIFIDDCSTDNSREILRRLKTQYQFQLIEHSKNEGKGQAVIHGITQARGTLVMIQDADFEYDVSDVPSLIAPLVENRADVIYGSRFRDGCYQVHRTYHYFINRFLTFLSNLLSGIYLTDMETCYKIFRSDLVKSMRLTSKRFGIEIELTAYIAKTSARIFELPIHYYPRTRLHGKKINWKDGVAALFHLVRFNFCVSIDQAFEKLPGAYLRSDHLPNNLRK